MTRLLIHDGPIAPDAPVLRTGGTPLVPAGFTWPTCESCEGAMQFLAHLPLTDAEPADAGSADRVVSVFMCQNDPGMCDEWEAFGGNSAFVLTGPLAPAAVPAEGETTLGAVSAARVEEVPEAAYHDARSGWAERQGASPRQVLGSLGGEPEWIQGDETPACAACGGPMGFVGHLEEGEDHATAMNFGGGAAYVFACPTHETAAFLWQQ